MTTEKNAERHLWMLVVLFVTYLLIGSFILSKNYLELGYLILLYITVFFDYILNKKTQ